ncbi:MAG: DapH/DapD/GlmU-related protein [Verrucomicrobiota bacterium]
MSLQKGPYQVDLPNCINPLDRRTKIRRGLWHFIIKPLYRFIPGKRSALRLFVLRRMGAQIGYDCTVQQGVDILMPWNLILGDHVAIAREVKILNFAPITIHPMTVISQYAHLCAGSHDYTHPHFTLIEKPINIGAESWVASGSFIGPGVTLGRGCVIGANSVVTKDMPEWTVCAGNPCRPLKERVMQTTS